MQRDLSNTVFSFLGAPGSGKGTLARRCEEELGFAVLSTGDLCRKNIAKGTDLGRRIKSLIDSGNLIPDDLVTEMVKDWLDEQLAANKPIILDGYPRTVGQYMLFQELRNLPEYDFKFRLIFLDIEDDSIVKRLVNRLVCSNKDCQAIYSLLVCPPQEECICDHCGSKLIKRSDDREDVIRDRLVQFHGYKDEILKYCESVGIEVESLKADGLTIDQIFEDFLKIL